MKRLLIILILTFSFQSLTKADDISDFEIEGMSIGDSLLEYFDESIILNNPRYDHTNTNWNNDEMFQLRTYENGPYTEIMFALKKNDKKYIIYSISGLVRMDNNISKCYKDMKSVALELEELFPNTTKSKIYYDELNADKTGNSKVRSIYFDFNSGDYVAVQCYDWAEPMGYWDNLRIILTTKVFNDWNRNSRN